MPLSAISEPAPGNRISIEIFRFGIACVGNQICWTFAHHSTPLVWVIMECLARAITFVQRFSMALPDTFARRKRSAFGSSDPLRYDIFPYKLRVQALHILDEAIEIQTKDSLEGIYQNLCKFMRKELGKIKLSSGLYVEHEFSEWFLNHQEVDDCLVAVEHVFRIISVLSKIEANSKNIDALIHCVAELNGRFLEAGVGYQFENGKLLQVDSKLAHKEIIVPALHLLAATGFEAAEHEFLDAFDAFRTGDFETVLIEACKSLESTIKVIGARMRWGLEPTAPLKKLIQAVFDNNLIPDYMQAEFAGLRTILESGTGTVRNKAAGHGAGEKMRAVPRHIAAFQLHQTAAAILLLVEAAKTGQQDS